MSIAEKGIQDQPLMRIVRPPEACLPQSPPLKTPEIMQNSLFYYLKSYG
jgi:hypothetical protein